MQAFTTRVFRVSGALDVALCIFDNNTRLNHSLSVIIPTSLFPTLKQEVSDHRLSWGTGDATEHDISCEQKTRC